MYSYGLSGLGKISDADATSAVRQIFLELLEREPDPGARPYVDCLLERENKKNFGAGSCNVDDIRTNVLKSEEYRRLQEKKAAKVYGAGLPSSSAAASSFAPGGFSMAEPMGGAPMTIAGIPIVYLAGGLVLLMLLKKR